MADVESRPSDAARRAQEASSHECEHGASSTWWWDLAIAMAQGGPAGWSGPLDKCGCCGAEYGYIDSANYGAGGLHGRSWTKGKCGKCGGHYVEF